MMNTYLCVPNEKIYNAVKLKYIYKVIFLCIFDRGLYSILNNNIKEDRKQSMKELINWPTGTNYCHPPAISGTCTGPPYLPHTSRG